MSKAIIDESTLTNLANKIRVLNGTEDTMTPVQMDSELGDANNEVAAQSALIDQLSAALDGKAGKVSTITGTIKLAANADSGDMGGYVHFTNSNCEYDYINFHDADEFAVTIMKNSFLYVEDVIVSSSGCDQSFIVSPLDKSRFILAIEDGFVIEVRD